MEYSTLNKCVMAFGKANSCMDMYNNTHGAYVEIDGEHYIKIDSTIIMDVDSGVAMETHFYAEFNATIEEMKSPTRRVKAQTAIYDTAVADGDGEDDDEDAPLYYCKELSPGDGSSLVWNVTNAEKVGETESEDGKFLFIIVWAISMTACFVHRAHRQRVRDHHPADLPAARLHHRLRRKRPVHRPHRHQVLGR